MTKNSLFKNLLFFILFVSITSCVVSKKKYDELLGKKVMLEGDKGTLEEQLKNEQTSSQSLAAQKNAEIETLKKQIADNKTTIEKLEREAEDLNKNYQTSLTSSGKLGKDLAKQQQDLLAAEAKLETSRAENEKLSADLKAREARVKELEKVLAAKDSAVNLLKNKVSKALLNFKENDLTVNVKNGKVYVSLAEQLLFKSGSTSVDPKGVEALKQLANALKGSNDINVLVEGHTDDVRISKTSQYMNDNWDLSVMRATSIARILTGNGVSPTQITAAGRGEYFPLDNGKTAEARQKNRRTEIILTPKLDELFQILGSN